MHDDQALQFRLASLSLFDDDVRAAKWVEILCVKAAPAASDLEYLGALLRTRPSWEDEKNIASDVTLVAGDSDFFIFAERCGRLMRAFVQDVRLPRSGCTWPTGCVMLMAPMCFLYDSDPHALLLFRQMWIDVWQKVHSCIPVIAFNIRRSVDLDFCFECQEVVTTAILRWIRYGFVGALALSQVLLVWDMMLQASHHPSMAFEAIGCRILQVRKLAIANASTVSQLRLFVSDLSDVDVANLLRRYPDARF